MTTRPTTTQPTTNLNGFDVPALRGTIQAIDEQPALGAARFSSASEWQDDRRVESSIQDYRAAGAEHSRPEPHVIPTDLPTGLLGTDRGPSPLELALAALTSCVTTTLVAHATARDIGLESLRVEADADLDLRGMLDLSGEVRRGFRKLRLRVSARAALPDTELDAFVRSTVRFSPVLDLFQTGTEVVVERR